MARRKSSQETEQKNLPSGLQAQKIHEDEEEDIIDEDSMEVFREVGHIPDRDQLFGTDRHRLPPPEVMAIWECWSGDMEDTVEGDRDKTKDALEELHDVENIVSDRGGSQGLGDLPEGKKVTPQIPIPREPEHIDRAS